MGFPIDNEEEKGHFMTANLFLGGLAVLVLAAVIIVLMTSNRRKGSSDNLMKPGRDHNERAQKDDKG